jgi:excisionase family DNA binding protein
MNPLLTVEEAARELHISVSLLHHLTSARVIAFTRLGRRLYFSEADLQTYINSRRVEPVSAITQTRSSVRQPKHATAERKQR